MRSWLFVILLALAACGSKKPDPGCAASLPDVVYVDKASDEALEVVWCRLPEATVADQLTLTSPAPGATVSMATPPMISWAEYAENGPHLPVPYRPSSPHRGFSLISRAWAHKLPVTGNIFLVELKRADATLRIFSTVPTYTPTTTEWNGLTGGQPGTITVRIWSAYLEQNVITEGPYESPAEVSFTTAATP